MARLVIVSNRVGAPGERAARAGGLAVAMRDALRQNGGIWFGWSGEIADASSAAPHMETAGKVTYATVDLSQTDHDQYYIGYANSTLWPLLHYRLSLVEYKRRQFNGYLRVNTYLAQQLRPLLKSDDVIWVHDYHLIPFAAELRKLGVGNQIGFFLHTPFPPPELVVSLPHHGLLMEAISAYDLIGFQTAKDTRAFLNYITAVAGGRVLGEDAFEAYGKRSRAAAFPIGIDTEAFARLAEQAVDSVEAHRLRESIAGRSLIIGVDRLDYSKGIPSRFEAIDGLLSDFPDARGRFTYLQITPHSRSEVAQYRALRRQLEAAAGRVNGQYAEFDWTPIRYVNKSFSRQTLAGFYRVARVGLVTPLIDGMNLVAKEFVAAQNPEDPGVLILSRFAGAAQELQSAVLVNPFDVDEMSAALHRSLGMSAEERHDRWVAMMSVIQLNTITTWRESFLHALRERPAAPTSA